MVNKLCPEAYVFFYTPLEILMCHMIVLGIQPYEALNRNTFDLEKRGNLPDSIFK